MSRNTTSPPAAEPFGEPAFYTVKTFCHHHGGISPATLYRLWAAGKGPRRVRVGARTMVPVEAAREWRAQLLAEAEGGR